MASGNVVLFLSIGWLSFLALVGHCVFFGLSVRENSDWLSKESVHENKSESDESKQRSQDGTDRRLLLLHTSRWSAGPDCHSGHQARDLAG